MSLLVSSFASSKLALVRRRARSLTFLPLLASPFLSFLHLYMKYTQPLFIQSIMTLKGLYESKSTKLHLFGAPAVGDLKRPFPAAPSMFGESPVLISADGKERSGLRCRAREKGT